MDKKVLLGHDGSVGHVTVNGFDDCLVLLQDNCDERASIDVDDMILLSPGQALALKHQIDKWLEELDRYRPKRRACMH